MPMLSWEPPLRTNGVKMCFIGICSTSMTSSDPRRSTSRSLPWQPLKLLYGSHRLRRSR
ncbi:hypothetical protein TIFTF001_013982 [Ficus carica]|uniref:Uncharacterized protein n=1 Tax=Ficus carica TaxID=3494 RepID=A0AA88A4G7_FICCA|nr:hypothetical protein TIFTF001_013982 [Ficus carica]